MTSVSRLVDRDKISGAIEVRRNGDLLEDPYVATLTLRNSGRLDVAKAKFEGIPLRFDLGTTILEILEKVSAPAGLAAPEVHKDGSVIVFEPGKIGGSQTVDVTVLVDGRRPKLAEPDNPLDNVKLRPAREISLLTETATTLASAVMSFVIAIVALITLLVHR